jgi:hypothetical protein
VKAAKTSSNDNHKHVSNKLLKAPRQTSCPWLNCCAAGPTICGLCSGFTFAASAALCSRTRLGHPLLPLCRRLTGSRPLPCCLFAHCFCVILCAFHLCCIRCWGICVCCCTAVATATIACSLGLCCYVQLPVDCLQMRIPASVHAAASVGSPINLDQSTAVSVTYPTQRYV